MLGRCIGNISIGKYFNVENILQIMVALVEPSLKPAMVGKSEAEACEPVAPTVVACVFHFPNDNLRVNKATAVTMLSWNFLSMFIL